jgi:signal transduction histidine kinase
MRLNLGPLSFRRLVGAGAALYALAVCFVVPTVLDRGGTIRTTGWTYAAPGTPPQVTSVSPDGPAAGLLQPGDRILSINGQSDWRGLYGPERAVWNYPIGSTYSVRLLRAGQTHDITLSVTGRPTDSAYPLITGFLAASLVFLLAGIFIGWQRPELFTARLLWAACQLTALVYVSLVFDVLQKNGWQSDREAPLIFLCGRWNIWFCFWFVSEFPSPLAPSRIWRLVNSALAAICAADWLIRASFQPARLFDNQRLSQYLPAWWLNAGKFVTNLFLVAVGIALIAALIRNYRAAADPGSRRRIELVAGAIVFGCLVSSAGVVASNIQNHVPFWMQLAPVPVPIVFVYAVFRHRVLDLRLVIRRSLRFLLARHLLRLLTALPLIVLAVRILRRPAAPGPGAADLVAVALIAASVIALEFRERIIAAIDRWSLREDLDREKRLRSLLADLAHAESWPALVEIAERRLAGIFATPAASVLAEPSLAPDALSLAIVSANGREHGFLVLSPRASGEPYSAADRDLVALAATQIALVRDNLLLAAERTHIAREVHDTAGNGFAGISLYLEAARKTLGAAPEQAARYLEQAGDIARRSLQETRESVASMRVPAADLTIRLRTLAGVPAGPAISLDVPDGVCRSASPDVQWHLARVAEEAVANARKHSGARRISISLATEGARLILRVHDDGCGFHPAPASARGYGLAGMRERLHELRGTIHIASAPGQGTEIRADVPIDPSVRHASQGDVA